MALLTLPGCHGLTTIVTDDGLRYRGVLTRSDRHNIYLELSGGTARVPRGDIAAIQWPGQTSAIVGGSMMAAGVITVMASVAVVIADGDSDPFLAIGGTVGGTLFALGIAPLVFGVEANESAMKAAEAPDGSLPPHLDKATPRVVGARVELTF